MLLTFSGVDCSGKSTHIQYLENYFTSLGKTCTVFQFETGHSKEMQAVKWATNKVLYLPQKASRIIFSKLSSQPILAPAASSSDDHTTLHDIKDISTDIIDAAFQWSMKLRYLQRRYDVVICDRYIEDARIDFMFKYPNYRFTDRLLSALVRIMPKPDRAFLLWLPLETMLERLSYKDGPSQANLELRTKRYRAYGSLSDEIIRIDTSVSVEEAHKAILSHINDHT